MSKTATLAFTSIGCLVIGGAIWYFAKNPRHRGASGAPVPPAVAKARADRRSVDSMYASKPKEAEAGYKEFVENNKDSKVPEVQDEVGNARLRLGYLAAKQKDFGKARVAFQEAVTEYKGTGSMGSDFGGIKDQAAYQAAVTLMADGKKEEALKAFVSFMGEYKLSPLVHAAHRRLEMLEPDSQDSHDALLQAAVTAQEKHIRFETSVCGPKVISYLLEKLGKPKKDYKELAKLCGTTDNGTTVEGMRKGLKACGLDSFGYELNAADFLKLKAPALLLKGDHYVALIAFTATHVVVHDPVKGGEDKFPLPKPDQADFSIPVLTLSPLELQ